MVGFQSSGAALGGERGSAECMDPLDLPKELSHLMLLSGEEEEEGCGGLLSIDGTRALVGGDRRISSGSSTVSGDTQFWGMLGLA